MADLTTLLNAPKMLTQVQPTINRAQAQYEKAAPFIDWVIEYWWVLVIVAVLLVMGGSAMGVMMGEKATRRT